MISSFREEMDLHNGRTMDTLPLWSASLVIMGVLALAAIPTVSAQRGFGITGNTSPYKGYSGIRARPNATRLAYIHEQTIAVIEVGDDRELYNCEFIEVYKPIERKMTRENIKKFVPELIIVTFEEMISLMNTCAKLYSPIGKDGSRGQDVGRTLSNVNPVTLLSGILPGTKWCGTGDLAKNYFDLGAEAQLDKCCRAHDLCPVKVRAHSFRYNITNNSLYTKSHCTCDLLLQQCLKAANSPTGDIMGNIYFNLLKVPCVLTSQNGTKVKQATRYR